MANANAIPFVPESTESEGWKQFIQYALVGTISVGMLFIVFQMIMAGEWIFGLLLLMFASALTYVFLSQKSYVWRYVFPSISGVLIFIVFPMLYTLGISFTNYSTANLLSFPQAKQYLTNLTYLKEGGEFAFTLHKGDAGYQIALQDPDTDQFYVSDFVQMPDASQKLRLTPVDEVVAKKAPFKEVIQNRTALDMFAAELPDGRVLSKTGLRKFASQFPLYIETSEDVLENQETGALIVPNHEVGYYQDAEGKNIIPGFTVAVGFQKYTEVVTNKDMFAPFVSVFIWTLIFAASTVILTLEVGMILAIVVQWEPVKGRGIYQTLLILPYAIPAFISIQIFRGLFNPNFGDINKLIDSVLGLQPQWFTDPVLAKTMVLMVNTWLGYPYMFILCLGMLKSIPKDLYEASAIEGSGPISNFFKITLPLLLKPLLPLLIASFAFNFNNFILIELLTEGGPDILGSNPAAGYTDLLVNYAFGIAFFGDTQDFALASAISTFIFLIVGLIAMVYLKYAKVDVSRS